MNDATCPDLYMKTTLYQRLSFVALSRMPLAKADEVIE
jgi:hypothetical protein